MNHIELFFTRETAIVNVGNLFTSMTRNTRGGVALSLAIAANNSRVATAIFLLFFFFFSFSRSLQNVHLQLRMCSCQQQFETLPMQLQSAILHRQNKFYIDNCLSVLWLQNMQQICSVKATCGIKASNILALQNRRQFALSVVICVPKMIFTANG